MAQKLIEQQLIEPSFHAMPVHVAMGAYFGAFTFFFLLVTNSAGIDDLISASPEPRQTFYVLAVVFCSMFAVACGLTGFFFIAINAKND